MSFVAHEETDPTGLRLIIRSDDEPLNPRREFDNLCRMVCFHGRYQLGDPHSFDSPDDFRQAMRGETYLELPLYLYDHSSITMRTTPFSCPWDSGQVGVIIFEREKVLSEFGGKRLTAALREQAIELMRAEVKVYDQYLTGDIWQARVEGSDGEILDSCSGFYGLDHAKEEGRSMLGSCAAAYREVEAGALAAGIAEERPDLAPQWEERP